MSRLTLSVCLLVVFAGSAMVHGQDKLRYNRDIRPILSENCFACHGPDSAARKADLRLDKREVAVEMAPGTTWSVVVLVTAEPPILAPRVAAVPAVTPVTVAL